MADIRHKLGRTTGGGLRPSARIACTKTVFIRPCSKVCTTLLVHMEHVIP